MWGDTRGAPLFSADGYVAGCRYVAALSGGVVVVQVVVVVAVVEIVVGEVAKVVCR